MDRIPSPRQSFNPPPATPRKGLERIHGRTYRRAPVRGRLLPSALVRSTGLLTHMGTPREEWAILARALHVAAVAAGSTSDALRYVNAYTGTVETVERIPGTFQKSVQGFTEDLRRRIWKKTTAEGLDEPRRPKGLRTAPARPSPCGPFLRDVGPAVDAPRKYRRDVNGRRWTVAPELADSPTGAAPRAAVRCTGPAPRINWSAPYIDPLEALERIVPHRENLHLQFTEGLTCRADARPDGSRRWTRHRPAHATRSHRWHARNGSDRAAFVTVGRWREGEAERPEARPAVTVPWIVFELDGRDSNGRKDRGRTVALARRLVRRLLTYTGTPDALQISYTGRTSVHVRLAHAAVGCPIYSSERAATAALRAFVDGVCSGMPDVRAAVDDAALQPRQMIRAIGSTHQHGGRCIPVDVSELLHADPRSPFGADPKPHRSSPSPCPTPTRPPPFARPSTAYSHAPRQTAKPPAVPTCPTLL